MPHRLRTISEEMHQLSYRSRGNLTMKTRIITIALLSVALSGCVSKNAAKKFSEFEALGVTEAIIVGKFSSTEYKVTTDGTTRRAELDHSNAWLNKVRIVRETPAQ